MYRAINTFLSKIIFSVVFVYIMLLGILNLSVAYITPQLEHFLAVQLNAEKVSIGNVSNLPLVFINSSMLSVKVNDELYAEISDFHFFYRFWYAFTGQFEKIPAEIHIEKIKFYGHVIEINHYVQQLNHKFSAIKNESNTFDIKAIFNDIEFSVKVKRIELVLNSLTEFWNTILVDNLTISSHKGAVSFKSDTKINSIWSNSVYLMNIAVITDVVVDNVLESPSLRSTVMFQDLNLGGIPFVQTNAGFSVNYQDKQWQYSMINPSNAYFSVETNQDGFDININAPFELSYNDFEEFKMMDYVFKPAKWNLKVDISKRKNWKVDASLKSSRYPDKGLDLSLRAVRRNYLLQLDLDTDYFGALSGDLLFTPRPGLYPLPSGSLLLDNVRFVLNGLIFSGEAVLDAVPNKNELEITAFNVKMNNGLIGNTAILLKLVNKGMEIVPRPLLGSALDVYVSLYDDIYVRLEALDVDGDFVAQNTKLAIFGLPDSRYQGLVTMHKKHRKAPFILDANLIGYLDNVPQIDGIFTLTNEKIHIETFKFIAQQINLSGTVDIKAQMSNTLILIDGMGEMSDYGAMPISVEVDIQKNDAFVTGLADNIVPIVTKTINNKTDFEVNFKKYPLKKIGFDGNLTGILNMGFDLQGITRFNIENAQWDVANHSYYVHFTSEYQSNQLILPENFTNTNQRFLETTNFAIGMDRELYTGEGYFYFDNLVGGAIKFNEGGGIQYNIGRYVVKSRFSVTNMYLTDLFAEPILQNVSFLNGVETESLAMDADLMIDGTWSDLEYTGSVFLKGTDFPDFQLNIADFFISSKSTAFDNLKLRHSLLNLDLDFRYTTDTQQNIESMSALGTFTFTSQVRSEFDLNYTRTNEMALYKYELPKLYFLTKKPTSLSGTVIQLDNEYLLMSKESTAGITGSMRSFTNGLYWDVNMLNDGLRIKTEGYFTNQQANALVNAELILDKIAFSGGVRRVRGDLGLKTYVAGALDDLNINGEFAVNDLELDVNSVRNRILMSGTQKIIISNTQFIFPQIRITSRGGGGFILDGLLATGNTPLGVTDLQFYSDNENGALSFLNLDLDLPYLGVTGRTYLDYVSLTRQGADLVLGANMEIENLNISVALDDTLSETPTENDPTLALLSALEFDVAIELLNRVRVNNQLFNIELKQTEPIKMTGNVANNTVSIVGSLDVERGNVQYLNTDLKAIGGTVAFSGENGDPYPQLTMSTESLQRTDRNEQVDLFVDFEGKLPNVELTSISSSPPKSRSELFALLGFGGLVSSNANNSILTENTTTVNDLIASGVGVAENAFFTSPLTRRLQRLLPFVDVLEIKTDVLGNLTRSANSSQAVNGLGILNGTELEVGAYIPKLRGVQVRYNLALSDQNNTTFGTSDLTRVHTMGIEWSTTIPKFYNVQFVTGVNVRIEEVSQANQTILPEPLIETSLRKRF